MNEEHTHAGYEFESGMFSRVRTWTDIAPWVALGRTLRVLTAPMLIGLVTIAWLITEAGFQSLFGSIFTAEAREMFAMPPEVLRTSWGPFSGLAHFPITAVLIGKVIAIESPYYGLLYLGLLFLVWTPIIPIASRQGASLTAGRPMRSIRQVFRLLKSRCLGLYLVPLVPTAIVLAFMLFMAAARIPSLFLSVLSAPTGWALGLMSITAGLLAFGALFAVPLALTAMVNEQDPDPIDSLSRGYEYLLRRPVQLFWYLLVCIALGFVIHVLFVGVSQTGIMVCGVLGSAFAPDEKMISQATFMVRTVWFSAQLTLQLSLLGGVYLLLRRDAGGQHVEDLWLPADEVTQPMPVLPKEALE